LKGRPRRGETSATAGTCSRPDNANSQPNARKGYTEKKLPDAFPLKKADVLRVNYTREVKREGFDFLFRSGLKIARRGEIHSVR
jgi:hypothetical protein